MIFKDFCTKNMRDERRKAADFETAIVDNPIRLLQAIKVLTRSSSRAQYPMVAMTEAFYTMLNIKQFDSESLLDYTLSFKHFRDVLKSFVDTNILDEFTTHTQNFQQATDDAECRAVRNMMFEAWTAYLFLYCADTNKYGYVLENLKSQFTLKNDQYPKTLAAAIDTLSTHRIDPKYYESQRKKRENQQKQSQSNESTPKTASFAQQKKDVTCYCCGKKGHTSPKCTKHDEIPRDKWFKPQSNQAHHQEDQQSDDDVL